MKRDELANIAREARANLEEYPVEGIPEEYFSAVSAMEQTQLRDVKGDSASELLMLEEEAKRCLRCRLHEARHSVVFGEGNADAPLVAFVGEGPGADEDRMGRPFVGRAGKLLTAAITSGMGLRREDVYIANVVKCRPPNNRAPLEDEAKTCVESYLFKQLELISPRVIVTLGAPAQLALGGIAGGISSIRGKWLNWRGVPLMPTYHPAYILRQPSAKRPFWEDLQEVMRFLGLSVTV